MVNTLKKITLITFLCIMVLAAVSFVQALDSSSQAYAAKRSKTQCCADYIYRFNPSLGRKNAKNMARYFVSYGRKYNVSPTMLMAMAQCESGFNPRAYNRAGYYGVMQTTAHLGRYFGGVSSRSLFNSKHSIRTGAKYLKYNRNQLGSYERAVSGYCAGTGAVRSGRYSRTPARIRIGYKRKIDSYVRARR